jgi:undecaprenyl-diphosphatase
MSFLDALILGIIQGITEFFPISSSGHLVIFQNILTNGYEDFFYFSVFVHLATFFAVLLYFRNTVKELIVGLIKKDKTSWTLFGGLCLATLPAVVVVALTISDSIDSTFSSATPVMIAMMFTGTFFLMSEFLAKKITTKKSAPSLVNALIIGCIQAIAIIPGVSRSGSTLSAGLLTGLSREKAAEFSFLMALPAIFGAAVFASLDGLESGVTIDWGVYGVGFVASLISGYFAIAVLMQLYKKYSLNIFAIYLIAMPLVVFGYNLLFV